MIGMSEKRGGRAWRAANPGDGVFAVRPARPAELERAGPRAPCRGLRRVSRARRRGIWKKRRGGRALGGSGLGSGSASCVSGQGTEEGQARGPLGRSDLSDGPGPLLETTGPASDVNRRRPSLLCLGSSRGGAVARSRGPGASEGRGNRQGGSERRARRVGEAPRPGVGGAVESSLEG